MTGFFCPNCHAYIPPIAVPTDFEPSLAKRMAVRADRDGLPIGHLMRIRAAELEAKLDCEAPGWTAQNMIGAWARARRVWCDYTGEPML